MDQTLGRLLGEWRVDGRGKVDEFCLRMWAEHRPVRKRTERTRSKAVDSSTNRETPQRGSPSLPLVGRNILLATGFEGPFFPQNRIGPWGRGANARDCFVYAGTNFVIMARHQGRKRDCGSGSRKTLERAASGLGRSIARKGLAWVRLGPKPRGAAPHRFFVSLGFHALRLRMGPAFGRPPHPRRFSEARETLVTKGPKPRCGEGRIR